MSHGVSVSSQLLPPGALARRLDRPIRLSLVGAYRSELNCRITAAGDACVAFIDMVTSSDYLDANEHRVNGLAKHAILAAKTVLLEPFPAQS